jgi:hypothetical protein
MTVLTLTPDERAFLAQLLESIITEHSAALSRLQATYGGNSSRVANTNVATLLHSWRSRAADLRERLASA